MLDKRAKYSLISIIFLIYFKIIVTNFTKHTFKIPKNYSIEKESQIKNDPIVQFILAYDITRKFSNSNDLRNLIENSTVNIADDSLLKNQDTWNKYKV